MHIDESIPDQLKPEAEAALAWINEGRQRRFELTGLVDADAALRAQPGESHELGLVLCDGEICAREQVRVQPTEDGHRFSRVENAPRAIPPLLDPPEGVRQQWLDAALARHEFVLLLFYRGLW